MPIGRILLKSISESKKLSMLKTDGARLLYTWLLPHVNVNGCFSADPVIIQGQVFTRLGKSLEDILEYLEDVERVGLIKRYRANGDDFLIIPDFINKQPSLRPDREGKVTIPLPPPEQPQNNSGDGPDEVQSCPAQAKLSKVNLSKANAHAQYKEPGPDPEPSPKKALVFEKLKEAFQTFPNQYYQKQIQIFVEENYYGKNADAIILCLDRLIIKSKKEKVTNPQRYLKTILDVENGNLNERESVVEHLEHKKPIPITGVSQIGEVFATLRGG